MILKPEEEKILREFVNLTGDLLSNYFVMHNNKGIKALNLRKKLVEILEEESRNKVSSSKFKQTSFFENG